MLNRKFLSNKAQILKDIEDQKITLRELAMKEAKLLTDSETKKVIADNKRIMEELKFHHIVTEELNDEKVSHIYILLL